MRRFALLSLAIGLSVFPVDMPRRVLLAALVGHAYFEPGITDDY